MTKVERAAYVARVMVERRAMGFQRLGSCCKRCGATENLEFDHIDPAQKSFGLTHRWGCPLSVWLAELAKCQVLCRPCHQVKSVLDAGKRIARGTHGTLSSFRHCQCDACREAKRVWQAAYDWRRRGLVRQQARLGAAMGT